MNEGQVTIDAHSYALPQPFLVIATQNPVEHHGTYPLPESQLDRFLMRLRMGYPDKAAEREIRLDIRTQPREHTVERAAVAKQQYRVRGLAANALQQRCEAGAHVVEALAAAIAM